MQATAGRMEKIGRAGQEGYLTIKDFLQSFENDTSAGVSFTYAISLIGDTRIALTIFQFALATRL